MQCDWMCAAGLTVSHVQIAWNRIRRRTPRRRYFKGSCVALTQIRISSCRANRSSANGQDWLMW